jgi:hypothetical protein
MMKCTLIRNIVCENKFHGEIGRFEGEARICDIEDNRQSHRWDDAYR